MQIDWITVVAQIINFLVLILLLKRFLYRPILNAMDARQKRIAAQMQEAEAKWHHAEEVVQDFNRKTEQLETDKQSILQQARTDADTARQLRLEEIRQELERARDAWLQELEQEKEEFRRDLRAEIAAQVCQISRRALGELADAALESQIVTRFLKRLHTLNPQQHESLQRATEQGLPIEVQTGFALSDSLHQHIESSLRKLTGHTPRLERTENRDLVCGIALIAAGEKLSWSVDEFLEGMENAVLTVLQQPARTGGTH